MAFLERKIPGPVVMLNLLRFRRVADDSAMLHLAPVGPISGAEIYRLRVEHALPHLGRSGGEVIFLATAAVPHRPERRAVGRGDATRKARGSQVPERSPEYREDLRRQIHRQGKREGLRA